MIGKSATSRTDALRAVFVDQIGDRQSRMHEALALRVCDEIERENGELAAALECCVDSMYDSGTNACSQAIVQAREVLAKRRAAT